MVAPEKIIYDYKPVAPELRCAYWHFQTLCFGVCGALVTNRRDMNREVQWLEKVGVELQLPTSFLGKFSVFWEECGSIIPAALGSSGLTGPSGTTGTYPRMDRPRLEHF